MMDNMSGSDLFRRSEISRPASPLPSASSAAAIPAAAPEKYSKEEREIISLLDAQIGNKLITKAKQAGSDSNNEITLQAIINENNQSVKRELREQYNPEVLRTAINKKLVRLETPSSRHTPLSKSVYRKFLNEFLGELTAKPRQTGRALAQRPVLPGFI
jgi:hypothetical protein